MKNKKHVVVLDHFDSFTYNLVTLLQKLGAKVTVLRTNSEMREVCRENPTHLVLSPGPGHPKEVTLFQEALTHFKEHIPIFGVCLGHQAIGLHFGASVVKCKETMHGKVSSILHNSEGVFKTIVSDRFEVCRYHSLAIEEKSIQSETLLQTAWSDDGTIMGVASKRYPHVVGVQFHPESYFTENGTLILANFLSLSV
jgi:anthranilate synthase/aminodeoxychorismate synthase-like glutamine amidotransferase